MQADAIDTELHVYETMDLIEAASTIGRDTYSARFAKVGDAGAAGFVSVRIPIDQKHRALIRDMADIGMGKFDPWWLEWSVTPCDFGVTESVQSIEVQEAGAKAFADKIREGGFVPRIRSVLD